VAVGIVDVDAGHVPLDRQQQIEDPVVDTDPPRAEPRQREDESPPQLAARQKELREAGDEHDAAPEERVHEEEQKDERAAQHGGSVMRLEIADLDEPMLDAAAQLLVEEFDAWPALAAAREEVERVRRDGVVRGAVDDTVLLGWVGGVPEYDGHVWELHPRGACTITLGTPDANGRGKPDIFMSKRL